ncbi:hypothetical protein L596_010647 [Steinernema carpocapsae]|nr:hypothetical protein L596_010647 [Steinernema carpocapsae]
MNGEEFPLSHIFIAAVYNESGQGQQMFLQTPFMSQPWTDHVDYLKLQMALALKNPNATKLCSRGEIIGRSLFYNAAAKYTFNNYGVVGQTILLYLADECINCYTGTGFFSNPSTKARWQLFDVIYHEHPDIFDYGNSSNRKILIERLINLPQDQAKLRSIHVTNLDQTVDDLSWVKKYGILRNDSEWGKVDLYVCEVKIHFSSSESGTDYSKPLNLAKILIPVFVVPTIVIVIGFAVYFWVKSRRRKREIDEIKEEQSTDETLDSFRILSKDISITYGQLLGKGSTSSVYKAHLNVVAPLHVLVGATSTSRFANCAVAVKVPTSVSHLTNEITNKELEAYRRLKYHDQILACLGWVQLDLGKCLVFDLATNGDLRKYVIAMRGLSDEEFNEKRLVYMFRQICLGMAYVASLNMIHRDVAARNILLTADNRVKISDFGLCCDCDESFTYTATLSKRLPIRWLSLEALVDRVFSEKSDV